MPYIGYAGIESSFDKVVVCFLALMENLLLLVIRLFNVSHILWLKNSYLRLQRHQGSFSVTLSSTDTSPSEWP